MMFREHLLKLPLSSEMTGAAIVLTRSIVNHILLDIFLVIQLREMASFF